MNSKSKLTIIILNSKPGDQQQAQIISEARRNGHEVVGGCTDSTYIFVPDADTSNNSDQMVKGSLIEVSNETDQELRSKGFNNIANALSKHAVQLIESDVKSKAPNNDQHSGTGVDWEVLNNLPHMKEACNI